MKSERATNEEFVADLMRFSENVALEIKTRMDKNYGA